MRLLQREKSKPSIWEKLTRQCNQVLADFSNSDSEVVREFAKEINRAGDRIKEEKKKLDETY